MSTSYQRVMQVGDKSVTFVSVNEFIKACEKGEKSKVLQTLEKEGIDVNDRDRVSTLYLYSPAMFTEYTHIEWGVSISEGLLEWKY